MTSLKEGEAVDSSIFSEKEIELFKEELDIVEFVEYIDVDIDDVDAYEAKLNEREDDYQEDDCDCEPHESSKECQCPQEYIDFEPMEEGGEQWDLEFAIEDQSAYHEGIQTYLAIKTALFAEDYEVYDLPAVREDKDTEIEVRIDEVMAKVIFRRAKGKVTKKKKCAPGMKLAGRRCLPQTGTQKAKMKKLGIKLKRAKKAMGSAKKKKAARIGKITKKRIKGRNRSLAGLEN